MIHGVNQMNKQPEALRLIQHMDDEWQEDWDGGAIRAELRRLHTENEALRQALDQSAPAQPLTDSELLERLANATPEQIDAWLTIARQHDHKKHPQPLTDEQRKQIIKTVAESIDSYSIIMTHWPLVIDAVEKAQGITKEGA